MDDDLLKRVLATQGSNGAFPSTVHREGADLPDWNGFVTAQVLRALEDAPPTTSLWRGRAGALDFLARCESVSRPGAFGFWPQGERPHWAPVIPEDADDTAVLALLLARHGRITWKRLRRIACTVLVPRRLRRIEPPAPPWLRVGAFVTWLPPGARDSVVDCCVNANVAGLLAAAGLRHLPGYREACDMIESGIRWAGGSASRARTLVPFYPDPVELTHALRCAVRMGADELEPGLRLLQACDWGRPSEPGSPADLRPVFGNPSRRILWTSPVVQQARRYARAISPDQSDLAHARAGTWLLRGDT